MMRDVTLSSYFRCILYINKEKHVHERPKRLFGVMRKARAFAPTPRSPPAHQPPRCPPRVPSRKVTSWRLRPAHRATIRDRRSALACTERIGGPTAEDCGATARPSAGAGAAGGGRAECARPLRAQRAQPRPLACVPRPRGRVQGSHGAWRT